MQFGRKDYEALMRWGRLFYHHCLHAKNAVVLVVVVLYAHGVALALGGGDGGKTGGLGMVTPVGAKLTAINDEAVAVVAGEREGHRAVGRRREFALQDHAPAVGLNAVAGTLALEHVDLLQVGRCHRVAREGLVVEVTGGEPCLTVSLIGFGGTSVRTL